MNLDWLIIGGGIHGVHIAARLLGDVGVSPAGLRIVDPGNALLERWRSCTATTGMTHLRSPSVHHLDLSPWSLQQFAGKGKARKSGLFAAPYNRPALKLFNHHCDEVMTSFGLKDLHIRDRAVSCSVTSTGVEVELSDGQVLKARKLVLALGSGEQLEWPEWAPRDSDCVHHVFQKGFNRWPSSNESVTVVGGGITAGQIALRLQRQGHEVHLVSRHPLRQHQFDSDPGWLGPKLMKSFNRERDPNRRRAAINQARHRGSAPPDVMRALRQAISKKQINHHEGEVENFEQNTHGARLRLSTGVELNTDLVLLATGFASRRPGGRMIDELVDSASLPCAHCGYPIVDKALRWHPHIHVSGPLAELQLGPTSRNIAGAREAGARLVEAHC